MSVAADRLEIHNSNSSSNESVSSRDGHELYGSSDMYRKEQQHYSSDLYRESDYYKRGANFPKENDLYAPAELYASTGGIPQKGSRSNLGIHPLPLYRPQPDNV